MAATITKSNIIHGIMEPLPPKGFPPGRIRWRLRLGSFALARVKSPDGIREFYVKEENGHWMPYSEKGRNLNA